MLSDNPTKTRGIEKAWIKSVKARYSALTISLMNKLKDPSLTINTFYLSPQQIQIYLEFVRQELDLLLVGSWQEQYQRRAYNLALRRFANDIPVTSLTPEQRLIVDNLKTTFTASSTLGSGSSVFPIHRDTLAFLYARSFEALKGVTDTMGRQISSILFDGVEQGLGIREIAARIRSRVGVAQSRSLLIAQTEVIQAFQRGTINQADLYGDMLGEEVKLRWLTRRDERVRPLHVSFHGKTYTKKQARVNISISPYRCRCGLTPVIKEADTKKKKLKFKKERQLLKELNKP